MKQQAKNRQHSNAINTTRRHLTVAGIAAIASATAWQLPRVAQAQQSTPTRPITWKTSSLTFDEGRIINVHNTIVLNNDRPDFVTDSVVITGITAPIQLGRVAGHDNNIEHLPVAQPGDDYTISRTKNADGTARVVIGLKRIHFLPTDVNGSFEIGVFDTTDPNAWVPVTNGTTGGDTLRVQFANAIPRVEVSRTGVSFRGGNLDIGLEATRELSRGAVTIIVHTAERNLQLARVVKGDNNIDPGVDVQPTIHYDTSIGRNTTTFTLRRVVFRPTDKRGGFTIGVFRTDTKPHWTQITNGPSYGKDTFRVSFRGASDWVRACNPARALSDSEKAAFFDAASSGNVQGVWRYLSPCVREIDATDAQGHTALILAAAKNHVRVVELLIAAGANLEIRDKLFGATALVHAINRGDSHIATVQLLLNADADANATTANGDTPLIRAAGQSSTAIVNALLATGQANINHRNNGGNTALMAATIQGHNEMVRMLINAGADPNIRSYGGPNRNVGFTPLMWAAYYNNYQLIDILGLNGAEINTYDAKHYATAFLWAALRGHTIALKYLKTLGADIHWRNRYGQNAYELADCGGKRGTATYLSSNLVSIFDIGPCKLYMW